VAHNAEKELKQAEETLAVYEKNNGSIRATAQELGISRRSVGRRLKKLGKGKKPIAAGTVHGTRAQKAKLPPEGTVKRYILTSAQNNTHVHDKVWDALVALAKHYDAEILVGTYSYNQNAYGRLAVKNGKYKGGDKTLWYDEKVLPFISDERVDLAQGLVWCGEMNILPTAANPLAGLESYSARKSAIFPHAKLAMRSVATMQGEGVKMNYTTGTVTQRNYIQKRDGLIAEHHHVYGGLLVEVNHNGNWWVRQLNADTNGTIQDLDVVVKDGEITTGNHVEAINWGDLHATISEPEVVETSLQMLDYLKPKYQFLHDVLEGCAINHHDRDNPHVKFYNWLRGLHRFDEELKRTSTILTAYNRPWAKAVVVDSNHDDPWIQRWLREYDYRKDPPNTEFFLKAQAYLYSKIKAGKMPRDVNMTEWCLREVGLEMPAKFLVADESYLICNKKIECGMHGDAGPNGKRGNPNNLVAMGRKANTGHTHSAGIYNGLYVAGTSTKLRWTYNRGPSSWSHSHIITYPTGKRSIVTIYNGAWRAE
jgi:PucR C-terminal helix-turn-helix domain